MNISRLSDEILEVHVPSTEYKIIWVSDLHYDSKYSQSDKLIKFLNDHPTHYVIIGGDGLDVMQFVNDRRGSKSDVKSEYNHTDYANRIIDDVRNKLILPFKDRIICWIRGNHDNSVIKHHI